MSSEIQRGSNRGKVVRILSEERWMDQYDVADKLAWRHPESAASVLEAAYRAGYLERREGHRKGAEYEYRRKPDVNIV